jgi:hypothetical protein
VNALAHEEVGTFLNENFVSSFQKVATFRIVATPNGGVQKQGGNVASYFCAPDGRVLHVVAGPVNAPTLLREARWVVDTVRTAIQASHGDGAKFKQLFRTAHAAKLKRETGLVVEPLAYDPPEAFDGTETLTYRDPTGQPLAPKLPPPPIDGPDVTLTDREFAARQSTAAAEPGNRFVRDKLGRRVAVNNQAIVHQLLAAHALTKIETLYGTVFETILGEQVSTRPVDVVSPFSWIDRAGRRGQR